MKYYINQKLKFIGHKDRKFSKNIFKVGNVYTIQNIDDRHIYIKSDNNKIYKFTIFKDDYEFSIKSFFVDRIENIKKFLNEFMQES